MSKVISSGEVLFNSAYNGATDNSLGASEFEAISTNMSEMFAKGFLNKIGDVITAGESLFVYGYNAACDNGQGESEFGAIADDMAKKFANMLGSEENKSNAYKSGSDLSKSGKSGIESNKDNYTDVAESLATIFANGLSSSSMLKKVYDAGAALANEGSWGTTEYQDDFEYTGEMAGQGFINGMRECIEDAYDVGTDLGRTVLNRMAEVLDVGSPSKEAEKIGMWTSLGYANGIEKYTVSATDAADRMARLSLQAADGFIADRQVSIPTSNVGYGVGAMNEGAMASLASNIYQAIISGISASGVADNDRDVKIIIDGREIFKVVQSEERKNGAKISNGAFSR